ncbi:beta-trefoil DNA-binding domain-containing protein [Syncephalastrum racemosum]|uniref:Beta-trefoil DNA-binding domain-containing protein n=1 Tax=Syncephalastrum racemosum TaxID=13706 RepID=A0A1X2HUA3_SYNRA|nr:beta-trefoil DNA-binding domain-containing protein [Syncephalastrum racemosum]
MDQDSSPIVSQRAFGSSKKIQFIDISQHNPRNAHRRDNQAMSIESLLDSNGEQRQYHDQHKYRRPGEELDTSKRRWTDDDFEGKKRTSKVRRRHPQQQQEATATTLTCYHAAVAQKSYGSEKRFLCPPPVVSVRDVTSPMTVSLSVLCETSAQDTPLEHRTQLNAATPSSSFKYLHVTGTAKAKQFALRVSLASEPTTAPFATFLSNPISIISKPSKKTSKARNASTCILTHQPVALFNRINSQTVRTKYLTSEDKQLCAKNGNWSPFEIHIRRQPTPAVAPALSPNASSSSSSSHQRLQQQHHHSSTSAVTAVTYGTEIILRDCKSGVTSPPVIVRKVDKGRIAACAYGPVSQMQKIALQLASTATYQQQLNPQPPIYLSAASAISASSPHVDNGPAWIEYATSRLVRPTTPLDLAYEEVDDYLCWTIVGISKFEYSFSPTSMTTSTTNTPRSKSDGSSEEKHTSSTFPSTSLPSSSSSSPSLASADSSSPLSSTTVASVSAASALLEYDPQRHALLLKNSNLAESVGDCYVGLHGPLPVQRTDLFLIMTLPSGAELVAANHEQFIITPDQHRYLELPILFKQQEEMQPTNKLLACDIVDKSARWSLTLASAQ